MNLNLNSVKNFDQRHKDIVYGFMKNTEKQLWSVTNINNDKKIPSLIINICLLFYGDSCEVRIRILSY